MSGRTSRSRAVPGESAQSRWRQPASRWIGDARSETGREPALQVPLLHPLRPLDILLAEDNAINQLVARRLLEKQGHSVTLVADGRRAVEAFENAAFDLILMDVQMPEIDGYEATAAIRAQEDGRSRTLILALTAHAMSGDRERCLQAGMDGFISKPIRLAELVEAMAEVCGDVARHPLFLMAQGEAGTTTIASK